MRYQVGQKIATVAFNYLTNQERKNTENAAFRDACYRDPLLHDFVLPTNIHIVILTVTEHHKVSDNYDAKDKQDCDGYVLEDAHGNVYHNQYPKASYGQLSDTANRRFTRQPPKGQEFRGFYDNLVADDIRYFETHLLSEVVEMMAKFLKDFTERRELMSSQTVIRLILVQETLARLIGEYEKVVPYHTLAMKDTAIFKDYIVPKMHEVSVASGPANFGFIPKKKLLDYLDGYLIGELEFLEEPLRIYRSMAHEPCYFQKSNDTLIVEHARFATDRERSPGGYARLIDGMFVVTSTERYAYKDRLKVLQKMLGVKLL